ncbi:MAG: DUF1971 domain-containing protein [Acidimicrobiia bacterium]|nr:DUF1971 domain-containing protein [Acidimicrobiia bacterium]
MAEAKLPEGATPSRATPTFTQQSVPPGLRAAHQTSVWAELVVASGSVVFVDEESGDRSLVVAGKRQVIAPRQPHHVEPDSAAEFFVQFYAS